MTSPLQTLIAAGTKLWLDSIDPDLVKPTGLLGATGRHRIRSSLPISLKPAASMRFREADPRTDFKTSESPGK